MLRKLVSQQKPNGFWLVLHVDNLAWANFEPLTENEWRNFMNQALMKCPELDVKITRNCPTLRDGEI